MIYLIELFIVHYFAITSDIYASFMFSCIIKRIGLTPYVLCFFCGRFNWQSAFLWVPNVLHKQTQNMCSSIKNRTKLHCGASCSATDDDDDNDVLSLNNSEFDDYVDHIYPIGFEIKDTTYTVVSISGPVKNETWRQKRWFQFPHYMSFPLATFQHHHLHMWIIRLLVGTEFQSLWISSIESCW